MGHFYCRTCDRSDDYATTSQAKGDGWQELETEGSAGAMDGLEYIGRCPDCVGEA